MSEWIVLMTPDASDSKSLMKRFPEPLADSAEISETTELRVRSKDSELVARVCEGTSREEGVADYGSNGLHPPSFRAQVPNLWFFMVQFRGWPKFRNFLQRLLAGWRGDLSGLWIDDGYGDVWNGPALLALLQSNPAWDWRSKKSWHLVLVSHQPIAFKELAALIRITGPEGAEVDTELREISWIGSGQNMERGVPSSLYTLETAPEFQDDPILIDMLAENFGHSLLGYSCFILRYNEIVFAKHVLQTILLGLKEPLEIQIDFDHGTVLSGKDTLEWFQLDPAWDWR